MSKVVMVGGEAIVVSRRGFLVFVCLSKRFDEFRLQGA